MSTRVDAGFVRQNINCPLIFWRIPVAVICYIKWNILCVHTSALAVWSHRQIQVVCYGMFYVIKEDMTVNTINFITCKSQSFELILEKQDIHYHFASTLGTLRKPGCPATWKTWKCRRKEKKSGEVREKSGNFVV